MHSDKVFMQLAKAKWTLLVVNILFYDLILYIKRTKKYRRVAALWHPGGNTQLKSNNNK